MNILSKEVSDIDMLALMETETTWNSRLFNKIFCISTTALYHCNCCFVYTKTTVLFFKTRADIVRLRHIYNIKDLPEKYIDMIIYDKLSKL